MSDSAPIPGKRYMFAVPVCFNGVRYNKGQSFPAVAGKVEIKMYCLQEIPDNGSNAPIFNKVIPDEEVYNIFFVRRKVSKRTVPVFDGSMSDEILEVDSVRQCDFDDPADYAFYKQWVMEDIKRKQGTLGNNVVEECFEIQVKL